MLRLGRVKPSYLEYNDHGFRKRFGFVKDGAGFVTGYDEGQKKLVELDDWCYNYYGGGCFCANLETLYFDLGDGNLVGMRYEMG